MVIGKSNGVDHSCTNNEEDATRGTAITPSVLISVATGATISADVVVAVVGGLNELDDDWNEREGLV